MKTLAAVLVGGLLFAGPALADTIPVTGGFTTVDVSRSPIWLSCLPAQSAGVKQIARCLDSIGLSNEGRIVGWGTRIRT